MGNSTPDKTATVLYEINFKHVNCNIILQFIIALTHCLKYCLF